MRWNPFTPLECLGAIAAIQGYPEGARGVRGFKRAPGAILAKPSRRGGGAGITKPHPGRLSIVRVKPFARALAYSLHLIQDP
jgi:hypothetical protein